VSLISPREATDPRAAESIDLFCYRARKYLGEYAAALGGMEVLVFTVNLREAGLILDFQQSSPLPEGSRS
jgi:acetate kinase